MYNEIFFASTFESNDPYDGKVFLSYDFDQSKWNRILEAAWHKIANRDALSFAKVNQLTLVVFKG